jgi:hypothetical protein
VHFVQYSLVLVVRFNTPVVWVFLVMDCVTKVHPEAADRVVSVISITTPFAEPVAAARMRERDGKSVRVATHTIAIGCVTPFLIHPVPHPPRPRSVQPVHGPRLVVGVAGIGVAWE